MSENWTLEEVDADGAIQEMAEKVEGSRGVRFCARPGSPPALWLAAVPDGCDPVARFRRQRPVDERCRHPQLRAHARVSRGGVLQRGRREGCAEGRDGRVREDRRRARERACRIPKSALGAKAVAKPKFDFKGTTAKQSTFQATAEVLEYTGVAAYLGQVGNIASKKILGAAGSILPIEAYHAAWIADIRRHGAAPRPAPAAFAKAKTKAQVLAAVKATGFIVG